MLKIYLNIFIFFPSLFAYQWILKTVPLYLPSCWYIAFTNLLFKICIMTVSIFCLHLNISIGFILHLFLCMSFLGGKPAGFSFCLVLWWCFPIAIHPLLLLIKWLLLVIYIHWIPSLSENFSIYLIFVCLFFMACIKYVVSKFHFRGFFCHIMVNSFFLLGL